MRKYVIVAESGADLTPEQIAKHQIKIVRMHVEMDNRDYIDDEITIKDLTDYYDRTHKVPKTAGVNPHQFEEIFAEIKRETPEAVVLHLCYSAQLSIGFQSSLIANDEEMSIYRIDTKQVSVGQAFVVLKTVELIEKQPEIEPEDLVKQIEAIVKKTRFHFVPGNLDYLRAGGRVSNSQYLGAKLLRVRPLIELLDGLMISTKKYQGAKKDIMRKMIDEFFKNNNIDKDLVFTGCSVFIEEDIKEAMIAQIKTYGVKNIIWFTTGAVITSHAGPGGAGLVGMEVLSD